MPIWLGATAAIFIIWVLFAWYTFGNIIPQSAVAKLTEDEGYPFAVGAIIWWGVYGTQSFWYYTFPFIVLLGLYAVFRTKSPPEAYVILLIWTGVYFFAASLVDGM